MNYAHMLRGWFGLALTDRASPAMLSLVFDVKEVSPVALQKRYGKEVSDFLLSRSRYLEDTIAEIKSPQFGIPITYRLVVTKKPRDADIVLSLAEGAAEARFIEVPRDVSRTHPYRFTQVVAMVADRLGTSERFTRYDLHAILHKLKVKKPRRSHYHYLVEATDTHLYSQDLVDAIVDRIQKHPDYLPRARATYGHWLKKRKGDKAS